jgi:hypothetical protein
MWLKNGRALQDVLGEDYTLLDLRGCCDTGALAEEFQALGAPIEVLRLDEERVCEVYGAPVFLLRPDLHIVWRGDGPPPDPQAWLPWRRAGSSGCSGDVRTLLHDDLNYAVRHLAAAITATVMFAPVWVGVSTRTGNRGASRCCNGQCESKSKQRRYSTRILENFFGASRKLLRGRDFFHSVVKPASKYRSPGHAWRSGNTIGVA